MAKDLEKYGDKEATARFEAALKGRNEHAAQARKYNIRWWMP
jgi:hypothetical protein